MIIRSLTDFYLPGQQEDIAGNFWRSFCLYRVSSLFYMSLVYIVVYNLHNKIS